MSKTKKQTAVEWLANEIVQTINYDDATNAEDLRIKLYSLIINIEKQAKAMEKEQIVDAVDGHPIQNRHLDGEQYYNETYNND